MYDRMLIPLDGSSLAEGALAVAGLIPSRLAYLLRVGQDAPEINHYISPTGHETEKRVVFRDGDEYLRRAGAALRAQGREVEELQSWGDPADRIVEMAADVDLIVMATHGRGRAGRVLQGSVADRVAHEASAPVLLVPANCRPNLQSMTRLLVPLDGSELAETALPTAVSLGQQLRLPIHLICVVEPQKIEFSGKTGERVDQRAHRTSTIAERAARIYLTNCTQRYGDDVVITCDVHSGAIISVLRSRIQPTDLIVMTTHGRRGLRRLALGSVADALVRQAVAPVLLLRADTVNAKADPIGSTNRRKSMNDDIGDDG